MTIKTSVKKSCIECTKSSFFIKKRRRGVLTNILIKKYKKKQTINDSSDEKEHKENEECNYIGCNYNTLLTIKCGDSSCHNWFHHTCQDEYDNDKYDNAFETMNSYEKRCRV